MRRARNSYWAIRAQDEVACAWTSKGREIHGSELKIWAETAIILHISGVAQTLDLFGVQVGLTYFERQWSCAP